MKTANDYEKEIKGALLKQTSRNPQIELTMENGDVLIIIPSGYGDIAEYIRTNQWDMIDYWLIEGGQIPYLGDSKLNTVCESLANYMQLLDELNEEKAKCKKYYEENHDDPNFNYDYYSDWHKDLFGFRPGREFGKSRHESVDFIITIEFKDDVDSDWKEYVYLGFEREGLYFINDDRDFDTQLTEHAYSNYNVELFENSIQIKLTLHDALYSSYITCFEEAHNFIAQNSIKKIIVSQVE